VETTLPGRQVGERASTRLDDVRSIASRWLVFKWTNSKVDLGQGKGATGFSTRAKVLEKSAQNLALGAQGCRAKSKAAKCSEQMNSKSQSEHVLDLCRELLDDIELSRLGADKLLLKCSRLARLVGSDEVQKWIGYEMGGYYDTEPLSLLYVTKTLRWFD
jgi:hypothetical protein